MLVGFFGFVVATLLTGSLLHREAGRWSERAALETLHTAVALGARGMDQWIAERFADAEAFSSNLRHVLVQVEGNGSRTSAEGIAVQASLDAIRQRYNYKSVGLVDARTRTMLFISGTAPTAADIERILPAIASDHARWLDLAPRDFSNEYRAAVVRRLESSGSLAHLVLLLEVEPLHLVRTLSDSELPSFGGSSTLMRGGASIQRFSLTRGSSGEFVSLFDDVAVDSLEHRLVTGSDGEAQGTNVNGIAAMGLRQELSLPGWYLVGQLDEVAVYAGLREQTRVALAAYGCLLVLVVIGLLAWDRADRSRQRKREAEMVDFYDKILRHGDALFILNDWRGKVVDASFSALEAFGFERQALLGRDVMELAPASERAGILEMVKDMSVGDSRQFVGERVRADGSSFFVEGSVGLLEIQGRRYFHSVARDVTHAREVQARLQQAASVFDLAPAAIVICDKDLTVVSANPAFTHITGFARDEIVGAKVHKLTTGADAAKTSEVLAMMRRNDCWEGELSGRRKNGEIYPRHMLAAAHRDANGEVYQYIGMFTDLSVLKRAQVEAEFNAHHDQLTNLPNRRRLDLLLPELLRDASERGKSLTVAMFNLDRFKAINESFGLAEGDKVLVEMAKRLQSALPNERLFHFGADEFVAVLDGAPVGHALTIDKALALVCRKLCVGEHPLAPSASVGVASYPEHSQDSDSLLRNACAALTTAKARGGNAWQLYDPAMNASAYDDMLLAVELRGAIDEGRLSVCFQPQARIANWSLVGMEALLRWNHPTRGSVPPSRFIPIAEASGLIDDLSRYVLEESCRAWSIWRDAGLMPPSVAVNVSALQFSHPEFVADVERTIRRFNVTPHNLVLELTESLIMDNSDAAINTMHSLAAMGVRIALDDFGTGYSSLCYLTRFPLDKLKIDRSFILPIGTPKGHEGEAIVKSVISMAKALQLRVVAEGVETEDQAQFLREHGCEEMQGYLYAKPLPVHEMRALLETTLPMRVDAPPSGYQSIVTLESQ